MMKLSDIGERGLIKNISSFLDIGDDAAYLRFGEKYLILSTDMFYSKTHRLPTMTYSQIGRFIVSVNLSDIASMGAKPFAFLLGYAGPDIEVDEFRAIILGAERRCKQYGVAYVGGDTKYSDMLTLSGTAIGQTKNSPILRSGARPGDLVAVTGSLGGASFACECLLEGRDCPHELALKALEPTPRVDEGVFLSEYATSMTDISDSLAVCLHNMCASGDVGFRIDGGSIPIADGLNELSHDPLGHAIYGGGDYELVFTVPPEDFPLVEQRINAVNIGSVTSGGGVVLVDAEGSRAIEKDGYEHFAKN